MSVEDALFEQFTREEIAQALARGCSNIVPIVKVSENLLNVSRFLKI